MSWRNQKSRIVGAVIAAACVTTTLSGGADQSAAPEWLNADDMTTADKTAIVSLARRAGLGTPRRVSVTTMLPLAGAIVSVASEIRVSGARRTWRELWVCRRDWPCASQNGARAGRWVSGAIRTEEAWRIADGGWFIDVRLSDGVEFDAAQRIVLAIRHHQIVNRLPTVSIGREVRPEVPAINLDKVWSIGRSRSYPDAYEVQTSYDGTGEVFTFRLNGGAVEIHATGRWVARLDAPPDTPEGSSGMNASVNRC